MTTTVILLCLVPVAYLLGAVPFGLIVGKAKGVDPRTAGSGNIGATNVGRLLGMRFFFLVFVLDMLKGLLPMALASWLLCRQGPAGQRDAMTNLLHLLIGLAGILGHMFSVFIGFKGGKGVATSAGVALGLYPFFTLPGLLVVAVWAVVYGISRYVSLASMIAAVGFPIAFVVVGRLSHWDVFGRQLPLFLFAVLVGGLIVVRHRSNLTRLRAGTETRFTGKAGKAEAR